MTMLTVGPIPSYSKLVAAMGDLARWKQNCHAASLHLIRSGVLGKMRARVARGWAQKVSSQHSWVVIGPDCYAQDATIIDPTLWSYRRDVKGIWIGSLQDGIHKPHGLGSIWTWGRVIPMTTEFIKLKPKSPLSEAAKDFLKLLGPLDRAGWQMLASLAPVEGWPAGEILAAMDDTPALTALVPIDKLGMLTDRNPGNMYW